MPAPAILLALAAAGLFVATRKKAAALPAAAGGPAINPVTNLVVFQRFTDADLAAGDMVQLMGSDGTAYVLTVTAAQSAASGPQWVGTAATQTVPTGSPSAILFQAQDVAAVAPAGSSPTDTSAWTTSESGLSPVLQAFNTTDPSSIAVGDFVRLQDTRGAGTGIVANVTAIDPTTGHMTGAPSSFQGIIVPPVSVVFSAANVAYVAADAIGTPPSGATTTLTPLTNPVFESSPAGFTLNNIVAGDVVILTALDGTSVEAVITGWNAGGISGQVTSGLTPGQTILFDVTEIQGVAPSSNPSGFATSPQALAAAAAA